MPRSWKTTLFGGGGVVTALFTLILQPLMDADPATVPDWTTFIPLVIGFIGMLFAKDYNVTGPAAPPSPDTATK